MTLQFGKLSIKPNILAEMQYIFLSYISPWVSQFYRHLSIAKCTKYDFDQHAASSANGTLNTVEFVVLLCQHHGRYVISIYCTFPTGYVARSHSINIPYGMPTLYSSNVYTVYLTLIAY